MAALPAAEGGSATDMAPLVAIVKLGNVKASAPSRRGGSAHGTPHGGDAGSGIKPHLSRHACMLWPHQGGCAVAVRVALGAFRA